MARNFQEIRDEVMFRLGREGVTAFESRAETLVDAVYREICQTWHHHELDAVPAGTATLSAAATSFDLPSDRYLVYGVRLKDGSTLKGRLGYTRAVDLFGQQTTSSGLPEKYARYGDKIYVDRPADTSYTAEIFYYKRPTDPDFSTPNSPEIDPLFDEIIIEWATARGQGMLWRPDLASAGYERLGPFWQRVANAPLRSGLQVDRDTGDVSEEGYGGALG